MIQSCGMGILPVLRTPLSLIGRGEGGEVFAVTNHPDFILLAGKMPAPQKILGYFFMNENSYRGEEWLGGQCPPYNITPQLPIPHHWIMIQIIGNYASNAIDFL